MPEKKFSVTLKEIIDEFSLETIHLPMDASKLLVIETEITVPVSSFRASMSISTMNVSR